jgi:signal transduction histidine kinase/ligand-binding sensor domain-containing protein
MRYRHIPPSGDPPLTLSGDPLPSGCGTVVRRLTPPVIRASRLIAATLGALLLAGICRADDRPLSQLFHHAWGLRQGAPGAVVSIAQTADGYLWLATPAGLHRFDGVRFERYTPRGGSIPRRVTIVRPASNGGLWIGANPGGVTFLAGDQARPHPLPHDGPILELADDGSGGVWAATPEELLHQEGSAWTSSDPSWNLPPGRIDALLRGRNGMLWVLTGQRLYRRPPAGGPFTLATPVPALTSAATGLAEAPDGTIWISQNGSSRAVAGGDGSLRDGPVIARGHRNAAFDRAGRLWLATEEGIVRVTLAAAGRARVESITAAEGLSANNTFATFEDREGNIWVGTGAGLDFFRESLLTSAPVPPGTHAMRVEPDPDGGLWVGSYNRPLIKVDTERSTTYPVSSMVVGVSRGPDRSTWAWTAGQLWRLDRDGRIETYPAPPDVGKPDPRHIAVDHQGRVWLALARAGLLLFANGEWSRPGLAAAVPRGDPRLLFVDRSGRIWLSSEQEATMVDGAMPPRQFPPEDVGIGRVLSIADSVSGVWLGGEKGVALFDGTAIRHVHGIDNTSIGRITGIVEADDRSLWLNADRGVVRIPAEEWPKAIADLPTAPAFRVFDYLDGVIGGAAPIPPQSAAKTSDGRLWFVGFDNLVSIDPRRISTNPVPPPVHIQSVASGGTTFALEQELRLPARTSNLQIKYTALSLSMPERVRFRYRLDGADEDWTDAGSRREAFYTNLRPGSYVFRVTAANNDGVWNETGAVQAFVIPPALHQTMLFRSSAALGVVLGAVALYRGHVRRLRSQMHERIEERMNERERIARELHDTLLQGFQGLVLKFQAVATRIPAADPNHALLEDALTRADSVLIEGRDRVRGLRGAGASLDDLPAALTRMGDELARETTASFAVAVTGPGRPLHPVVRDEAYWILREGLINAFRHGQGHHVDVAVTFGPRELRVRLEDDGRGVEEDVLRAGGRAQHWGLPGMRERASRLGASLELSSRRGAGTAIELRIPAHVAYRPEERGARPRWWQSWRMLKARSDGHE